MPSLALCLTLLAAAPDLSKATAAANTTFALELYGKLAPTRGNLVFSPYSLSSALAMTWAGARGQTADEMGKTLHFSPEVHDGFAALDQRLVGAQPGYELAVANRLFIQRGLTLLAPFTTTAKEKYRAPVEQVDFTKEETRLDVNKWVEDQTHQRIKELISKGVFTSDTRLTLINAVYFKGTWLTQFDKKATTPQPFFTGGKEVRAHEQLKVPLMYADLEPAAHVRTAEAEDVQVLELPYKDGDVAMVVLLPTARDGLAEFEKSLTPAKFEQLMKRLRPSGAEVWLPRFKVEQGFEASRTLAAMGMPGAFGPGADFSGMTGGRELSISAVIHKAFIEVNEEGTEAAAATAVVVGIESVAPPKLRVRVDHPFLFALRDTKSGTVLFLGRMVEPR